MGKGHRAKVPPKPSPAPTPTQIDEEMKAKDRARRRQRLTAAGRQGTILTEQTTGSATLLGRSAS